MFYIHINILHARNYRPTIITYYYYLHTHTRTYAHTHTHMEQQRLSRRHTGVFSGFRFKYINLYIFFFNIFFAHARSVRWAS